jgi:hypothetical protein
MPAGQIQYTCVSKDPVKRTGLLPDVIGLLAIAGAAYADGFSHQSHLKLKPDCLSCHPKAAASSKIEDNLLPEAQACAPCHQERAIRQPRPVRLKRFDHAFHVKMGNPAPVLQAAVRSGAYLEDPPPPAALAAELEKSRSSCTSCHRGMAASTNITANSTLHFPRMADCLVCHSQVDPPFSCETCHGDDKTLKPAFHTNDYLDRHTTKAVAKQGCANCHGRKFTCLGCH